MNKFVNSMLTLIGIGIITLLLWQMMHPEALSPRTIKKLRERLHERANIPHNVQGVE